MGVQWLALPESTRSGIEQAVQHRLPTMIPQGLSNTIYGLAIMGAQWSDLSPPLQIRLQHSIVDCLGRASLAPESYRQVVANVIYSLGVCGASWQLLEERTTEALLDGLILCGPFLIEQEISNTIYG